MGRDALWLVLAVLACCLHARSADKNTDENRPYEFGFTIDGEQHRHEKKDENGLIMGEFGFITADGVYHVTVYATDENGNFKILSMKNIRVKPYPTAPKPEARAIQFSPAQPIAQAPQPSQPRPAPAVPVPSPARSCSHCSIPTTPAPQLTDIAVISRDDQQFPPYPNLQNTRGRQLVPGENLPAQPNINQVPPRYDNEQNTPGQFGQHPGQFEQNPGEQQPGKFGQQPSQFEQQPGQFGQQPPQFEQQPDQFGQQPPQFVQQPGQFGQQPKQFGQQPSQLGPQPGQFEQPQEINSQAGAQPKPQSQEDSYDSDSKHGQNNVPEKPTLISAQMRVVDSNTDIHKRGPGEREGLPSGLKQDDMLQLLYTFNYTVGFHGHHEEGYTNGVKKGYYFVTGRNGVRTRVDYVADSEGFHPKISNEVLDLISEDVPKPETEKDEKYGLKGYEFKWIYFPLKAQR